MTTAESGASPRRIPEFDVADRMKKAREAAGLDQQQLADAIGLGSRNTVSNYETRVSLPNLMLLRAWARATATDEEWLTGDYVKPPRKRRQLPRLDSNQQPFDNLWFGEVRRISNRRTLLRRAA